MQESGCFRRVRFSGRVSADRTKTRPLKRTLREALHILLRLVLLRSSLASWRPPSFAFYFTGMTPGDARTPPPMTVKLLDLQAQYLPIRSEISKAIDAVCDS